MGNVAGRFWATKRTVPISSISDRSSTQTWPPHNLVPVAINLLHHIHSNLGVLAWHQSPAPADYCKHL